jgi:ABC-type transporter Mla subunit MlaD
MAQAQQAIADVDALLAEQRPNIRKAMANMRLTSDQLKLASIEVRSQPWRLLHEPDTKELATQVLYDATRSYAAAASDVRAASEALSQVSLAQRAGPTMTDADLAKSLADLSVRLRASMESFATAERKLLETLVNESK